MESAIAVVFQLAILSFSVVIHEVSHGLAAHALGDPTAKNLGRLSLNPIKHLDLFGSIILPLMLFVFRVPFLFGYAKPVPYNPANLTDQKYGPVKVALAGPASNIVLALLFGLTLRFFGELLPSLMMVELFKNIVLLNLALAVFNMFPVPPLDGHWLLMALLPPSLNGFKSFIYQNSFILFPIFLIIFMTFISPWVYIFSELIIGLNL